MTTDNNRSYDQNDLIYSLHAKSSKSSSHQENINTSGEEMRQEISNTQKAGSDNSYLDDEFSNALERDDQQYDDELQDEDSQDDEELDPDDLDDDLTERYDENDREPETFSDDGYKID